MLSRTANHLYWMARQVERAENTARILDVTYRMSLMPQDAKLVQQEWFAPLNITGTLFPFSGRYSTVGSEDVLHYMVLDADNPSSIFSCARAARENARAVRGSITSEMWEVLNSTWLELQRVNESRLGSEGVSQFCDWVKERSHLFRGVTVGTALRDQAMPVSKALKRLLASPAMMVLSREPAIARIAFDIVVMPCRNSASPPASPISMGASEKVSWSMARTYR